MAETSRRMIERLMVSFHGPGADRRSEPNHEAATRCRRRVGGRSPILILPLLLTAAAAPEEGCAPDPSVYQAEGRRIERGDGVSLVPGGVLQDEPGPWINPADPAPSMMVIGPWDPREGWWYAVPGLGDTATLTVWMARRSWAPAGALLTLVSDAGGCTIPVDETSLPPFREVAVSFDCTAPGAMDDGWFFYVEYVEGSLFLDKVELRGVDDVEPSE